MTWIKKLIGKILSSITVIHAEKFNDKNIPYIKRNIKDSKYNVLVLSDLDDLAGLGIMLYTRSIYTHCALIHNDIVYHSISKGVVKEPLDAVLKRYNTALLLRIDDPLVDNPENWLGVGYDYNLDYDDHKKVNCVEFLKIVFGIKDKKVKYPKHVIKFASRKYLV